MVRLSGDLDPAGGLVVLEALPALSEGAALDPQDTRTPARVRADALVEICRRHFQVDPGGKPRPASVLVTVPGETLQAGRGVVDTEAGPITAATARRLAGDATVSRVLPHPESVPIERGQATRVVSPHRRRVLELPDGGCTHPGRGVSARFCDAHHLVHSADGGQTVPANLRLLCSRHHTQAHQDRRRPKRE